MHDGVEFEKNTRRMRGATTTAVRNGWLTTPHKSVVSEANTLAKDAVYIELLSFANTPTSSFHSVLGR